MGDLGMDSNKYSVLNKLFTRNSLRSIIENGSSENYEKSIAQFLSVDSNTKNIDILIALYDIMNKEYRILKTFCCHLRHTSDNGAFDVRYSIFIIRYLSTTVYRKP